MKIKLKISEKQLNALVYSFGAIEKTPTKDRGVKVARSVLDKIVLKFKKKQLEVQQEHSLFKSNKKHNFSLEIVEAHFLEQFTVIMDKYPLSGYDRNALRQIQSTLNQQLA